MEGSQANHIKTSSSSSRVDSPSVKLALAMALVRSNHLPRPLNVLSPSATSDQIRHWKQKGRRSIKIKSSPFTANKDTGDRINSLVSCIWRLETMKHYGRLEERSQSITYPPVAKERKREIVQLKEEIKLLQDGLGCESEPPIASCRCHFFEGCGEVGLHVTDGTGDEHWIDNVLRRRFIRLVRWKERRRMVERPIERKSFMEFESEDEIGRLSVSIDFLVELSDNVLAKGEVDSSFSTFSHQAIDFILASLKNVVVSRQQREPLEEITNGLIMRLINRMCTVSQSNCQIDSGSGLDIELDPQFCVQHIIRKLGKEEFVGQRMMLSLSQKITIVAENLLLLDPFHDNFPNLHASMFLLIQLIEFMISDYVTTWLNLEQFDKKLFEEWVRSILKARKDLEILENMNGLYILYMDRVVALLAKEVGPSVNQGKLDPQVFSKLLS